MKHDGYTLDIKRNEDNNNDIPDIIARFNNLEGEASRTRKDQSFFVSKDDIVANNYELTVNKYKEVKRVKVEYDKPDVILNRIRSMQKDIDKAIAEYEVLTNSDKA